MLNDIDHIYVIYYLSICLLITSKLYSFFRAEVHPHFLGIILQDVVESQKTCKSKEGSFKEFFSSLPQPYFLLRIFITSNVLVFWDLSLPFLNLAY